MLGGAGSIAAGSVAAQLLGIIAIPVLTRLYTPDDFGILAIYASLLAILVIIANLRYDFAIVVPRSTRAAANVAAISIATAATVSATVGLALIIWSRPLAEFLNAPLVGHYMWLLPISAFGAGVYQTLNYWA